MPVDTAFNLKERPMHILRLFTPVLLLLLLTPLSLYARDADVNSMVDRDTLLCNAIRDIHKPEYVKELLKSPDIDVNKRGTVVDDFNEWTRTPLILAAMMGQAEIVQILLNKGADINARDSVDNSPLSQGNSALMRAAARNHTEVVRILLANPKKPDVSLKDQFGWTAVCSAVENENLEMVKLLTAAGSKINAPDAHGLSLLTLTVVHKNFDVLDFLVAKGADINLSGKEGITTLMCAVSSGGDKNRSRAMKYLEKFLKFKPNVNFVGTEESALHIASRMDFPEAAGILLDHGADINIANRANGGSPLHSAVLAKKVEMAKYLIKRKANLEHRALGGTTPLGTAVSQADFPMVKALVEGGAVINTANPKNTQMTPLNIAALFNDPFRHSSIISIMNYLLDKKGNVDFKSVSGLTALMASAQLADHKLGLENAELLVKRGAKLNLANNSGETALMLAANGGNEKLVRFLVDKGADVKLKSSAGTTALGYAKLSGQDAIVRFLESKGAASDAASNSALVTVKELIGNWEGPQPGRETQAVIRLALNKDNSFHFESRYTAQFMKQVPFGLVNPVIEEQKGSYTIKKDVLVLMVSGKAPLTRKWKLVKDVLILNDSMKLKKLK